VSDAVPSEQRAFDPIEPRFIEPARDDADALPRLREAETILLYGGGFDPPHAAHVELPPLVRARIGADDALYIPAARTPLKEDAPVASDADRLEMLRLALRETDHAVITDLELLRGGTSYTIDTLRLLREIVGERPTFRLLIGADQARSFHRWKDAREVIDLAEPALMRRPDDDEALFAEMAKHWTAEELDAWRSRLVETPLIDVSSTALRTALRTHGPDHDLVRARVPERVRDYIRRRGLYRDAAHTT